jgi:hypothetical protein
MFSVPVFFATKRRYLKRPSLKLLASLLLALPERATDFICYVMTSMVMGMLGYVGVWNAGMGTK